MYQNFPYGNSKFSPRINVLLGRRLRLTMRNQNLLTTSQTHDQEKYFAKFMLFFYLKNGKNTKKISQFRPSKMKMPRSSRMCHGKPSHR